MGIYDTAVPFAGAPPTWLNEVDRLRLNAYAFYEALYINDTTAYKITLRDDEENPIYIPSAKRIVRTMARYVCKGLTFKATGVSVTGEEVVVNEEAIAAADFLFGNLFKREEFFPNFRDAMEIGLAHGDWAAYVLADPLKAEGSRISIRFIDPGMVFYLFDADDVDRIVGVQLVEHVFIDNKEYLKRQRWVKPTSPLHPSYDKAAPEAAIGNIYFDSMVLELTDWEDPVKAKVVQTISPQIELLGITQLPVYVFRNRVKTGEPYGVSELQGIERLIMGVHQSVTDEDVALAMQGLGMYASNTRPTNDDGEDTDWVLGPRRVVELNGPKTEQYFERITGVTTVAPYQDHYKWLLDMAESTAGINPVALGEIDTTVAESGIALALRFGPILDEATRKDDRILSKLAQFWHDLKEWFAVYEGIQLPPEVEVLPVVGPKLPIDIDKEAGRLQDLFVNGVISTKLYLTKLNELGFDLGDPDAIIKEAQAEAADRLKAQQDAMGGTDSFGDRLDQEAGDEPVDE